MGRALEAGIDIDDGSIDSIFQGIGDLASPIMGFNIPYNKDNFSIITKL
jgi:hypothetical protein